MFRMLLFVALIGLALANYNNRGYNDNRRGYYRRPQLKKSHHMTALDQLIKKKPAMHFLGRGFVNKALYTQGENKFLQLNGKEERDLNGTIQINKQNVFVDVSESKDGHFLVQNSNKKVVGRVDMHSGSNKHLTMHRAKNGEQYINGHQTGNAVLNVEQDMATKYPYGSYHARHGPKKHMQMRVVQNHETSGSIHITNDRPQLNSAPQQQQYNRRYRRQAASPVASDCQGMDCLLAPQQYRVRRQAETVNASCRETGEC